MRRTLLQDGMARWGRSLTIGLLVAGACGSQAALAQISLTKHYLVSRPAAPSPRFDGSAETCVFCHTPRGADSTAAVPLWNRALTEPATYTTYNCLGSSSQDGASAPVGSVSIVCLSCHDGVQALNVSINAPRLAVASASTGTKQTPSKIHGSEISSVNVNVDVKGEHPFGTQYGGGALAPGGPPLAPGVYLSALMRDSDFNNAQSSIVNGQSVWWVDTAGGAAGARDKTDIQLYTRLAAPPLNATGVATAGQVNAPEPFVECASCHDPHSAANATFLRFANTGSAVCLACHSKM